MVGEGNEKKCNNNPSIYWFRSRIYAPPPQFSNDDDDDDNDDVRESVILAATNYDGCYVFVVFLSSPSSTPPFH